MLETENDVTLRSLDSDLIYKPSVETFRLSLKVKKKYLRYLIWLKNGHLVLKMWVLGGF